MNIVKFLHAGHSIYSEKTVFYPVYFGDFCGDFLAGIVCMDNVCEEPF
jgi:hypothetical protein